MRAAGVAGSGDADVCVRGKRAGISGGHEDAEKRHEDPGAGGPRIPNVAMYFFYKVGSRNERPGTTGISHFFEHMMFNGAKKYGPGEFDSDGGERRLEQRVYHAETYRLPGLVSERALELIFDLEADRIANLRFDPKRSRASGAWWRASGGARGRRERRRAGRAALGDGVHRASLPVAGGGLDERHRAWTMRGSEEPLPHGLRAEQLRRWWWWAT